jgi:hypothetical protein
MGFKDLKSASKNAYQTLATEMDKMAKKSESYKDDRMWRAETDKTGNGNMQSVIIESKVKYASQALPDGEEAHALRIAADRLVKGLQQAKEQKQLYKNLDAGRYTTQEQIDKDVGLANTRIQEETARGSAFGLSSQAMMLSIL